MTSIRFKERPFLITIIGRLNAFAFLELQKHIECCPFSQMEAASWRIKHTRVPMSSRHSVYLAWYPRKVEWATRCRHEAFRRVCSRCCPMKTAWCLRFSWRNVMMWAKRRQTHISLFNVRAGHWNGADRNPQNGWYASFASHGIAITTADDEASVKCVLLGVVRRHYLTADEPEMIETDAPRDPGWHTA